MDGVTYAPLTAEQFTPRSLDGFIRRQHVTRCWRRVDGALVLCPAEYIDDWTLEERHQFALEILTTLRDGGAAFGAFSGGSVVGFAAVAGQRLGSRKQYADLSLFYVSEPFRGRGIGKKLFRISCGTARGMGAERLYISAHSAQEVIAAYRALGCVEAEEPDPHHAAAEPCDVQMERLLDELYHGSATADVHDALFLPDMEKAETQAPAGA